MTERQPDEAIEKLNQGIEESRKVMQRRTMGLAQEYFSDSVQSFKQQIGESRATIEGLPDQLPGGQEESFQMLFQELMDSYSKIESCLEEAEREVAGLDTESLRRQGEVEASDAALRESRERDVDLTRVEGSGDEGRVVAEDVWSAESDATDAARREAEKRGIDLSKVEATGADGRIIISDVVEFAGKGESETQAKAVENGLSTAGWIQEISNGQAEPARITSAARGKAEDLGVDLSRVEGSGAGGLVTLKDVENANR